MGEQVGIEQVAINLMNVIERVRNAARRTGRDASEIIIVGATKSVDVERIKAAIAAGLTDIGENYVQEALRKYEAIGRAVRWHFIGHLQTNKAKHAIRFCDLIQSLDRLSLAEELNKRAAQLGRTVDVLVQVNIGQEETKSGVPPDELIDFIRAAAKFERIRIRGLMCIPPYKPDPEDARPYFRMMRMLFERE